MCTTREGLIKSTLEASIAVSGGEEGLTHDIRTWQLSRDEISFPTAQLLGSGAFGSVKKVQRYFCGSFWPLHLLIGYLQGILRSKTVAVKEIALPSAWRQAAAGGHLDQHTSTILSDFRNECALMTYVDISLLEVYMFVYVYILLALPETSN